MAWGSSAQVILRRQTEKPYMGLFRFKSERKCSCLSPFFTGIPEVPLSGTLVAIYATVASMEDTSYRVQETVEFLAILLKQPILHPYTNTEIEKLAAEVLTHLDYEGKMVLICLE